MRNNRYYPYGFADPPGISAEQVIGNQMLTLSYLIRHKVKIIKNHQALGSAMVKALISSGWTVVARSEYDRMSAEIARLRNEVEDLTRAQEQIQSEEASEEGLPPVTPPPDFAFDR